MRAPRGTPRVGTRVAYFPNPASHALYSNPPRIGEAGTVTTVAGPRGQMSYMPGPGGGLVYVDWDEAGVMGIAPQDLMPVYQQKRARGQSLEGSASSVSLTKQQWQRLRFELAEKREKVKRGYYGPPEPGSRDTNERWMVDLRRAQNTINNFLKKHETKKGGSVLPLPVRAMPEQPWVETYYVAETFLSSSTSEALLDTLLGAGFTV